MEPLKHECGVAMVRLLKPLEYYKQKYGTWMYGLNKLYLMMEKQHNRGQEGAGMGGVKLESKPGEEYMFREKAAGKDAITEIFANIQNKLERIKHESGNENDLDFNDLPFAGQLYMGHLRYSTTGKKGLTYVHPFLRRNNWKAKNLCICGNFNMTNLDEVHGFLMKQGQCPRICSDGYIMLDLMGHRLDREVERNFIIAKCEGLTDTDITHYIEDNIKIENVLKTTMQHFDGGYVVCGLTGSGEMFSMRDPHGIRPAFYYIDDEVMVLASERPVIQTTFNIGSENIKELEPGKSLIVRRNGECRIEEIIPQQTLAPCSFERIYFSRGNDKDIYQERKQLGKQLLNQILKSINNDIDNTVLSFIPNTAEVAFYGMKEAFDDYMRQEKIKELESISNPTAKDIEKIVNRKVRSEKIAWKDIKLRTFITEDSSRNDLASHVYDITYNAIHANTDNLVIIDDSIVRGTTLKESIFYILEKLGPKKIIIVSSAPQIRYPDYYGIDMARLEEFCAFRATIQLLKEQGKHDIIEATYRKCKEEITKDKTEMCNCVRDIYKPFTQEEISRKISEMLIPHGFKTPVEIIFQTIEGLHEAVKGNNGDWYFTGNYPTPGGIKLCNQAFINYIEKYYQFEQKF